MRAKLATERGSQNTSENLAVKFMRELGACKASRVKRPIPFRPHDPCKRGHFATQESPFEVVPSEVALSVLLFDASGGLLRFLQQRLLGFG